VVHSEDLSLLGEMQGGSSPGSRDIGEVGRLYHVANTFGC